LWIEKHEGHEGHEVTEEYENREYLRAPFPWFGGKSRVAALVWERFGDVPNYVEPFFGSGAVLLGRPAEHGGVTETVNDIDGFVANFWRAVAGDAEAVASYCDAPVNENDLHARHSWLVARAEKLRPRLEGDPDFYDAKIAGWWCWGLCCWIGGGFCNGKGPWRVVDGQLVHLSGKGQGVRPPLVHLGDKGQGVHRQLVHLGNKGRGVHRQRMNVTNDGVGATKVRLEWSGLYAWFAALQRRLRHVRVCCGSWSRVCTPTPTVHNGLTGVFLDPPYSAGIGRDEKLYRKDSAEVAAACRKWALGHAADPRLRIALCGYAGEHEMPETWACVPWKARGGYGSQNADNANAARERIWFSPHCLRPERQRSLFETADENGATNDGVTV